MSDVLQERPASSCVHKCECGMRMSGLESGPRLALNVSLLNLEFKTLALESRCSHASGDAGRWVPPLGATFGGKVAR